MVGGVWSLLFLIYEIFLFVCAASVEIQSHLQWGGTLTLVHSQWNWDEELHEHVA